MKEKKKTIMINKTKMTVQDAKLMSHWKEVQGEVTQGTSADNSYQLSHKWQQIHQMSLHSPFSHHILNHVLYIDHYHI